MSKYGSNPSKFHYQCLKSIAKYLQTTDKWGIIFHRKGIQKDFPNTPVLKIPNTSYDLPNYPTDTTDAKLVCFVDAAYRKNPTKIGSTTCGYSHLLCTLRGCHTVYQSKAQSITALSSTKAELIAAVTAAKT